MNSESHYGVPILFLKKNKRLIKELSVLSELKVNYIDSQARNLIMAIQSTILISKLSTISTTNCAICVTYF